MNKYTHFNDQVEYKQAPESWLVQAIWLAPAIALIVWIIFRAVW
jgi:hypothetical protein